SPQRFACPIHRPRSPPHLHSFPTRRSSDLPKARSSSLLYVSTMISILIRSSRTSSFSGSSLTFGLSCFLAIGGTPPPASDTPWRDRKSTRLNSSHLGISYAVFCLKKKKTNR